MATWQELIDDVRGDDVISDSTLTSEEWLVEFDNGWGYINGAAFTAWSDDFVYFPVAYDAGEWVGRVRRNPSDEATKHQGGGARKQADDDDEQ